MLTTVKPTIKISSLSLDWEIILPQTKKKSRKHYKYLYFFILETLQAEYHRSRRIRLFPRQRVLHRNAQQCGDEGKQTIISHIFRVIQVTNKYLTFRMELEIHYYTPIPSNLIEIVKRTFVANTYLIGSVLPFVSDITKVLPVVCLVDDKTRRISSN